MNAIPAVLAVLTCSLCHGALQAGVPRPDLQNPADYLVWLDERGNGAVEENAAGAYRDAIKLFHADAEVTEIISKSALAQLKGDERLILRDWVHRNEECLSRFADAARVEGCYFGHRSDTGALADAVNADIPYLENVAQLLVIRARLRSADGNVDGAAEDVLVLLRCAQHLMRQPLLSEYTAGLGMYGLACTLLMEFPEQLQSASDCARLLEKTRAVWPAVPALAPDQREAEMLRAWDALQRFSRDADSDGRIDRLELPGQESWRCRAALSLQQWAESLEQAVSACAPLFGEDHSVARDARQRLREDTRGDSSPLLRMLQVSFVSAAELYRTVVSQRNGAQVVLGLHAYRLAHGHWPQGLEALDGRCPRELRQDPFSGQELRYRLEGEQPLVYSVGGDGTDDGGRPAGPADERGDLVLWPTRSDLLSN